MERDRNTERDKDIERDRNTERDKDIERDRNTERDKDTERIKRNGHIKRKGPQKAKITFFF